MCRLSSIQPDSSDWVIGAVCACRDPTRPVCWLNTAALNILSPEVLSNAAELELSASLARNQTHVVSGPSGLATHAESLQAIAITLFGFAELLE